MVLQITEFLFTSRFDLFLYLQRTPMFVFMIIISYILLGTISGIFIAVGVILIEGFYGRGLVFSRNVSIALSFFVSLLTALLLYRWVEVPLCNALILKSDKIKGLFFIPILLFSILLFFKILKPIENNSSKRFHRRIQGISKPVAFLSPFFFTLVLIASFVYIHTGILSPGGGYSDRSSKTTDGAQVRRIDSNNKIQSPADPPNLLLITIDTLRADHLHLYGYDRIETPTLDNLGQNGTVFLNAVSQSSVTRPSHSSILTGVTPPNHGVRNNITYILKEDEITLAEILSQNGYITTAFVSAEPLRSIFGIDQGFSHYDDQLTVSPLSSIFLRIRRGQNFYSVGSTIGVIIRKHFFPEPEPQRKASLTLNAAKEWLQVEIEKPEPFFVWIHLFDPHTPYDPPPPFDEKYKTPVTQDSKLDSQGEPVSRNVDLYDGEITYVDTELGKFFKWMKQIGAWENTLKVVTSDHGESFEKDYLYKHSKRLYDSIVLVPLLMHFPETVPSNLRIEKIVRLIDVAPTILDILGLPTEHTMDGHSLVRLMDHPEIAEDRDEAFPRFASIETSQTKRKNMVALRGLEWKMIYEIDNPVRELYNLLSDPEELINLYTESGLNQEDDSIWNIMEDKIVTYMDSAQPTSEENVIELAPESLERLKTLGYVD